MREKPESIALDGLSSVRSAKAARLKRIRRGYYSPPGGPPVFVPGMQWLSLLVTCRSGPPALAAMRWWSTRGERAEANCSVEEAMLRRCAQAWGASVVHVFDRGFAGTPWLEDMARSGLRFVLRWPKHYRLENRRGDERPAWQWAQGKRTPSSRPIWDAHRNAYRDGRVLWLPVRHPVYPGPLWLVVSRRGKGSTPWSLLTKEPIDRPSQAWRVVFAYARRWQVEMAWRFGKSELAMESPRLWFWENRLKQLLMVSLTLPSCSSCPTGRRPARQLGTARGTPVQARCRNVDGPGAGRLHLFLAEEGDQMIEKRGGRPTPTMLMVPTAQAIMEAFLDRTSFVFTGPEDWKAPGC